MGGNFACSLAIATFLLFCETMIWFNSKSFSRNSRLIQIKRRSLFLFCARSRRSSRSGWYRTPGTGHCCDCLHACSDYLFVPVQTRSTCRAFWDSLFSWHLHFQRKSRFRYWYWYCIYIYIYLCYGSVMVGPLAYQDDSPQDCVLMEWLRPLAFFPRFVANRVKIWSGEIWMWCNKGLGNFNMIPENLL